MNFYGLSEMCGPGVAAECIEARDGLHVHEDHFLVEVVDPESGTVLPEGDEGELVFTTLAKEAMPLPALPHRRHRLAHLRALPLRPDDGEDPRPARPPRRHDHRPRRQRLPLERRARAPLRARGRAALPARRRARRRDGRAHGAVRACAAETSIRRACGRPSSGYCASSSASAFAPTCWSTGRCREARARPCASSTGADESISKRRPASPPPAPAWGEGLPCRACRAASGQQKGSKRPKSSLSIHPQIRCQSAQTRMNRAIARQSSPIVVSRNKPVTPEVAGSSPVAPVKTSANQHPLLSS